jgi:hypothetical protein
VQTVYDVFNVAPLASVLWLRRGQRLVLAQIVGAGANPHFFGGTEWRRDRQPLTSVGRAWLTSTPCKSG